MWPRVTELLLGIWLIASPAMFGATGSYDAFRVVDVAAGALVVAFSVASFWRRMEWAHLLTAALGLGLAAYAYLAFPRPGPAGAQNEIVVGLLLVLFAIVPNEAARPPRPWRTEP